MIEVRKAYQCPKCSKWYVVLSVAKKCCARGTCDGCGAETRSRSVILCRECSEARRRNQCLSKPRAPDEAWDGPIYDPHSERFYASVVELLEGYECDGEEPPEYVHPCIVDRPCEWDPHALAEDIGEMICNRHDDGNSKAFEHLDIETLADALTPWLEGIDWAWWEPDDGHVIVLREGETGEDRRVA